MTIYYPDIAFLLNTGMDYLSLCCMLRLSGLPLRHRRILPAALLGGIYGAFAILPPFWFLRLLLVKIAAALLLVFLVCGRDRQFLRKVLLFAASSCALSGIATAVDAILWWTDHLLVVFLLSALLGGLLLAVVFGGSCQAALAGKLIRATLTHGEKSVTVTLCLDTGNTLRDKDTGEIVCVVEKQAIKSLIENDIIVYREIPFQSLGQENGRLLCFTCDTIKIGEKVYQNYPVGLAEGVLSDGSGFVGLWGQEDRYAETMAASAT